MSAPSIVSTRDSAFKPTSELDGTGTGTFATPVEGICAKLRMTERSPQRAGR
jgi:hypothetical protein